MKIKLIMLTLLLSGCASAPPENRENVCDIFEEKRGWYKEARKSSNRWGVPIPVMMSFVYQESGFRAGAKPPRTKILWVIPGPRPASAKGYSQAINETWAEYKKATGRWVASRGNFGDAIDFVGWYIDQSHRVNRIPKHDAYHGYLAYHEGQGGFARQTYKNKNWLLGAANQVSSRSEHYSAQLKGCEKSLRAPWFLRWLPFV